MTPNYRNLVIAVLVSGCSHAGPSQGKPDSASADVDAPDSDAAAIVDAPADAGIDAPPYSGPLLDLATLPGIHFGNDATVAEAAHNVDLVNAAAEQMRVVDGALVSSVAGTIMIGAPAGGSSGHLIHSGTDDGAEHGLDRWYLDNITFKLMPQQPMFSELTGTAPNIGPNNPSAMIYISHASAPELRFTLDGNAANQYQIDLSRVPGTHSHRGGFFGTGLELFECGHTTFAVTISNIRSITGSTGTTQLKQPGFPATGVPAGECFHMETRRGLGGDTGWIVSATSDGSDPGSMTTSDTRASGPVWHYVQEPHGPGTAPTNRLRLTSTNVRHGVGTYCGGTLQILNGSSFDGCEHDINLEAGIPNHADVFETYAVIIGEPGAPAGSIITKNASAIGIQHNGNSTIDSKYPFARGLGIDHVDVYGWDSTNDANAIELDGDPNISHFTVHDAIVHSPRGACVHFRSPADALKFNVAGTSRVHLGGAQLYNLTNPTIGSGTWDTSL